MRSSQRSRKPSILYADEESLTPPSPEEIEALKRSRQSKLSSNKAPRGGGGGDPLRGWKYLDDSAENVLGIGSYGSVRLVRHDNLPKRLFALKTQALKREQFDDEGKETYQREIASDVHRWDLEMALTKTMYQIDKIGPAFVDAWRDDEFGYSVTEAWDDNLYASQVHMTADQIEKINAEVQVLHSRGYVHADLYGTNILIRYVNNYIRLGEEYESDPQAILEITMTDFGISDLRDNFLQGKDYGVFEPVIDKRGQWLEQFFRAEPRLMEDFVKFREEYPRLPGSYCWNCLGKGNGMCKQCKFNPRRLWETKNPAFIGYQVEYFKELAKVEPFALDDIFIWILYEIRKFKSLCEKRVEYTWMPPIVCLQCNLSSETLYQCGKCEKVAYCGEACQMQHWERVHQRECGTQKQDEFRLYRLL